MRKIRGNTWSVDDIEESQLGDQRAGFQEEREGLLVGYGSAKGYGVLGWVRGPVQFLQQRREQLVQCQSTWSFKGGRGDLFVPALTILFYLICVWFDKNVGIGGIGDGGRLERGRRRLVGERERDERKFMYAERAIFGGGGRGCGSGGVQYDGGVRRGMMADDCRGAG